MHEFDFTGLKLIWNGMDCSGLLLNETNLSQGSTRKGASKPTSVQFLIQCSHILLAHRRWLMDSQFSVCVYVCVLSRFIIYGLMNIASTFSDLK